MKQSDDLSNQLIFARSLLVALVVSRQDQRRIPIFLGEDRFWGNVIRRSFGARFETISE